MVDRICKQWVLRFPIKQKIAISIVIFFVVICLVGKNTITVVQYVDDELPVRNVGKQAQAIDTQIVYAPIAPGSKEYEEKCKTLSSEYNLQSMPWMAPGKTAEEHIIVENKHFIFCLAWKVGTQYWKSLGAVLDGKDHVKDIRTNQDYKRPRVEDMLSTYNSAMFVRDPWSRLWSAYNDKFANLYPWFLMRYKKPLKQIQKKHLAPEADDYCLHNVTFPDFIDLVIYQYENKEHPNPHWRPYWALCRPCEVAYDFVGKLEHVKEDFVSMVNNFKLGDPEKLNSKITSDDYSSFWFHILEDLFDSESHRKLTKHYDDKCLSIKAAMEAKWRSLSNQGFISKSDRPPGSLYEDHKTPISHMDRATVKGIVDHAAKAIRSQMQQYNKNETKKMKTLMFENAISSLTMRQICAIEVIYKPDFTLFQYPHRCWKFLK